MASSGGLAQPCGSIALRISRSRNQPGIVRQAAQNGLGLNPTEIMCRPHSTQSYSSESLFIA
jgi:hypothetical protein